MKNINKQLIVILFVINLIAAKAQQFDMMPSKQRDSLLIAAAKEIVMKYGTDYYREYKPPIIERHKVPPKSEINPTGEMADRIFYRVIFLYNKEQEQLEYDYAARVAFWNDTSKPSGIAFGNGRFFMISDNWRTDTTIEQMPYQEIEIFPIYDLNNPDTNQEPKNKEELIRRGYERRGDRGEWVKTRPDVPPHRRGGSGNRR